MIGFVQYADLARICLRKYSNMSGEVYVFTLYLPFLLINFIYSYCIYSYCVKVLL